MKAMTNVKEENKVIKKAKKGYAKVIRFLSMALCLAMLYVTPVLAGPEDASAATESSTATDKAAGAGAASAEKLWTTLSTLIGKWVLRLGGVVIFVGGVMFALGWKNDDAEQKTRGIQTIIAGAIVMALAGMVNVFFA